MNSPRQKLAISSAQKFFAPAGVKIGCDHQSANAFGIQPNNSIFDLVAVRSPKCCSFQASHGTSGSAAEIANAANNNDPLESLPPRASWIALMITATARIKRSGRFAVLIKQVAAPARPTQMASQTFGRSDSSSLARATKAIPNVTGDNESP